VGEAQRRRWTFYETINVWILRSIGKGVDFIKVSNFFTPRHIENRPTLKKYLTRGYQLVAWDVIIKNC